MRRGAQTVLLFDLGFTVSAPFSNCDVPPRTSIIITVVIKELNFTHPGVATLTAFSVAPGPHDIAKQVDVDAVKQQRGACFVYLELNEGMMERMLNYCIS